MKRLWQIAKWFLIAWGIICFVAALLIGGSVAYQMGPVNSESSNLVSKHDVRFVLNWSGLGDERIEEVVHSYISSRSIGGDHLDAYAIRITHVELSELTMDDFDRGWTRCDQAEGVLDDAIEFAEGWLHQDDISWFPSQEELRSDQMYVYPWTIVCHGTIPSAVKLIFVRPKDKMVFYISSAS